MRGLGMFKRPGWWLWVGAVCAYMLTASGHYGGDGFFIYQTAESLVLDGDLLIGDRAHQFPDTFQSASVPGSQATQPFVTKYEPGLVLLEVPFYALGHLLARLFPQLPHDYVCMLVTSMTNVWVSAAVLLLFYTVLQRLGFSSRAALFWSLSLGFATPLWTYAKIGYREPLTMLGLTGMVYALARFSTRDVVRSTQYGTRGTGNVVRGIHGILRSASEDAFATATIFGFFGGLMVVTRLSTLPVLVGGGMCFLWGAQRAGWLEGDRSFRRMLLGLGLSLGLWALVLGWYNFARFGSPWETGLGLDATGLQHPFYIAAWGMLGSMGKGLLWYAPLAVLGLGAWGIYFRRNPLLATFSTLAIFAAFYVHGRFAGWTGGHGWGPRYVVFILPLLILSAAYALGELHGFLWRVFAVLLTCLGVGVQLPSVLINFSRYTNLVQQFHLGDDVFNPVLTPLRGNWILLCSAIQRQLTGVSGYWDVMDVKNHNFIFHSLRVIDLSGWDGWDLWWGHILALPVPSVLHTVTVAGVFMLLAGLGYSGWRLVRFLLYV